MIAVITAFFVNVVAVETVTEGDVLTSTLWACGDALKQSMQIEQCIQHRRKCKLLIICTFVSTGSRQLTS